MRSVISAVGATRVSEPEIEFPSSSSPFSAGSRRRRGARRIAGRVVDDLVCRRPEHVVLEERGPLTPSRQFPVRLTSGRDLL
jgi:hypothetical protein